MVFSGLEIPLLSLYLYVVISYFSAEIFIHGQHAFLLH